MEIVIHDERIKPVVPKINNILNNKFCDSSFEDSSSSGSNSEVQSKEILNLLKPDPEQPTLSVFRKQGPSLPTIKMLQKKFPKKWNIECKLSFYLALVKITVMFVIWGLCTYVLIEKKEKISDMHQISIPPNEIKSYWIPEHPGKDSMSISMAGAFLPNEYANLSSQVLKIWVEVYEMHAPYTHVDISRTSDENYVKNIANATDLITLPIVSEELIDIVPELNVKQILKMKTYDYMNQSHCHLRIRLSTNLRGSFPVAIDYDLYPIAIEYGVLYAALVLMFLYFLVIFEIVHRTVAGMLAATISIAVLAALDERPTMAELASWIDFETLLLLFSMMVLVAVFSETGVFDYLAVFTYRVTNGKVWPLINTLCFFTAVLSSFLDNVTTALLMTPVTIRLCEVTKLNPVPVLMVIMIYSNIGGSVTPVGDPPNVIVASHPDVIAAGVDFSVFFVHMFIGILLVAIVVHIQLRFIFRKPGSLASGDPEDVQDLVHEIAIWERTAASISSYSKDEDAVKETLMKKVHRLLPKLESRTSGERGSTQGKYKMTLEHLEKKYPIRNKSLLLKSGVSLVFVIIVFFLHSIPDLHLSLGCTAFMGALLLLLLADRPNIEGVLARVEWSTLLFFASLFILMESLSRLRLIEWIGRHTELLILEVSPSYQIPMSILLILWISATVSAFVDNIPLTTMMIRIVTSLAQNPDLKLPLLPLVWALCYGASLGGVATLIGSSSNVVCAGVAEQHGYRFSFIQYSKIGVPVVFVSLIVVSIYLMIAHVLLEW